MVNVGAVGFQPFATFPPTGWVAVTAGPSVTTITGGTEGLTIAVDGSDTPVVRTTTFYNAVTSDFVVRFPSSEGDGTILFCGYSADDIGSVTTGWQWDQTAGVVRAVWLNEDVYDHSILTGDRYFKLSTSFGTGTFYTSVDGVTWVQQAQETTSGGATDTSTFGTARVYIQSFPQTTINTSGIVSIQADSPPDPETLALTLGDARDLFRQWLDTVDFTQPNSSAVLTYQQVQAQTTGYAGTYGGVTVSGDTLKAFLVALFGLMANALSILGFLQGLWPTGHLPSDHDASLEAHRAATEPDGETLPSYIEGEIEIVLSAVTDQTNEITQILAHGDGTEDVPTIVGESDWGNIFRFDVPADFYTVDITTTDLDATSEDVAGTLVWDHLGFCIPLTVDGLPEYGPRLAIGGQVIRTGRQMGGIILNGRRVLSGHVTAYKYQPA